MSIVIKDTLSRYEFDSISEALRRISKWSDKQMISEKEAAKLIIQLFHEIPDSLYNSIQNEE
jgi:hypothetical protein